MRNPMTITGGLLGAAGIGVLVTLHLLPRFGGVDPVSQMISDYAVTRVGWLFDLAMVLVSVASALLGAAMVRHGVLRGWAPLVALGVWCAALIGVAVFAKDPAHTPPTGHGIAHLWVTSISCLCLPVLGGLVWLRFRADPRWRRWAMTTGALAVLGAVCMAPFVVAFFVNANVPQDHRFDGLGTGLIERVMVTVDVATMLVLTLWSRTMSLEPGSRFTWRTGVDASMLQVRTTSDTC